MKTAKIVIGSGLIFISFLFSCESDNDINLKDEFKIEFNDGTVITERNIAFYDSSTHLLFLKNDFELNPNVSDFNVLVENDTIYHGIIYPCEQSVPPHIPFHISNCFHYGNNIIEMGFYGASGDLRNDPRILNAFENSNLLHNGISCKIDNIEINSFDNYSQVICTITLTNYDNINYYTLDPEKMGDLDFNYFTDGLTMQNMDTKLSHPLRWSVQSGTWSNITMDDLSLLKKGSEVTYTFQSSDYYKMEPGKYSTRFRFCGTKHCTPDFKLNQKNGRVWVGMVYTTNDNIIVE